MTTDDINNMNQWPSFLKNQLTLGTKMTVDFYSANPTAELQFEIVVFEAPVEFPDPPGGPNPQPGDVELDFKFNVEYDVTNNKIKTKAKAEMKYYIC